MLKAILIDPQNRTITPIEIEKGLPFIRRVINATTISCVLLPNNDCVYIDDEGLFNSENRLFKINGYPTLLAGKALVLGSTKVGKTIDCKSTIKELNVKFYPSFEPFYFFEEFE